MVCNIFILAFLSLNLFNHLAFKALAYYICEIVKFEGLILVSVKLLLFIIIVVVVIIISLLINPILESSVQANPFQSFYRRASRVCDPWSGRKRRK